MTFAPPTLVTQAIQSEADYLSEWRRAERLRKALDEMAALVTGAYCEFERFETCGDPFCSEARAKRDAILLAAIVA